MKINVWNTIQQLSKERGVNTTVIVNAIKESLRVAATQYFSHNENIKIDLSPEKGQLRVYVVKRVVEKTADLASEISLSDAQLIDEEAQLDQSIEIDLPSATLGRIAAQQGCRKRKRAPLRGLIIQLYAETPGAFPYIWHRESQKNKFGEDADLRNN